MYRRLIDYYMETRQPLPDSDTALARIAGVSEECFKHASSILRAFFKQSKAGVLHLKKCDLLLEAQDKRTKQLSDRAKKAAKKRWDTQPVTCNEHTPSMPDAMLADAIETKTEKKTKEESKTTGSRFALTDLPDDWRQFCIEKRPDLNPNELFAEFRDYWIAIPGQRGRKLDWAATWRNRVRDKKPGVGYSQTKGKSHGKHSGFEQQDYRAGTEGFILA